MHLSTHTYVNILHTKKQHSSELHSVVESQRYIVSLEASINKEQSISEGMDGAYRKFPSTGFPL